MVLSVPNNTLHNPAHWQALFCDDECVLFALPARLGGLGLRNPAELMDNEFQCLIMVTDQLKQFIMTKMFDYSSTCLSAQLEEEQRKKTVKAMANQLRARLPKPSRK